MTKKKDKKDGLSITSLVLSIVGVVFCLTIIGMVLGIPLAIAALIFGIIAIKKKQQKGMAVAGIVISSITIFITMILISLVIIFIRKNADVIIDPIKNMSQMMKDNPEFAELMKNPEFTNEFEYELKNRLINRFGVEPEIENREDIKTQIPSIFEDMKELMFELKEKHQD